MLAPAAGTFGGGFRALPQQRRRRNLHLLDGRKAQKSSVCGELRGVRHSYINVPDFSDGVTVNMGLIIPLRSALRRVAGLSALCHYGL